MESVLDSAGFSEATCVNTDDEYGDEIEITKPRIPVVSNVDAKPHADPAVIRKILTAQVTAPVQWEQATSEMLENGYETGYELGPGAVVAGILKRVKKDAEIENVDVGPPKKAKK